jgi:hypothetical protein
MNESVFNTLNSVNCNEHTEKKNGLTYLSWAWAWAEVKKRYPTAFYTIYENPDGWNYFTDGRTCWVKTGVTIEGLEHIEYLPVMDYRNASIPADKVTSFDVNKAIQRSLTKAAARHGLGLYIYAGEDLPEEAATQEPKPEPKPKKAPKPECPEDVWYKLVKMEVEGLRTKSGLSPLQFLASKYHTDQLTLVKFNNDVQMARDSIEANAK